MTLRLKALAILGSVALASGCAASDTNATRSPGSSGAAPSARTTPAGVPFSLYTHCGVHELYADGRYFQRVEGPLTNSDANGPPPGWEDPEQRGWLVVEGEVATFSDATGHEEAFEERKGATSFLQTCL